MANNQPRTPYELRFDMYSAALERLKEVFYAKTESNRNEREEHYTGDIGSLVQEEPIFPTALDAIKEAKLIMAFVNGDAKQELLTKYSDEGTINLFGELPMDMGMWKWMFMGMMMGILFGKYVCGA